MQHRTFSLPAVVVAPVTEWVRNIFFTSLTVSNPSKSSPERASGDFMVTYSSKNQHHFCICQEKKTTKLKHENHMKCPTNSEICCRISRVRSVLLLQISPHSVQFCMDVPKKLNFVNFWNIIQRAIRTDCSEFMGDSVTFSCFNLIGFI